MGPALMGPFLTPLRTSIRGYGGRGEVEEGGGGARDKGRNNLKGRNN